MTNGTGDEAYRQRLRILPGTRWVIGVATATLLLLTQSSVATIGPGPVSSALSILVPDTSIAEILRNADGMTQYALIFLLAAIHWLEIVVVIPIGVAFGIHPFGVALFAFLENILPITESSRYTAA